MKPDLDLSLYICVGPSHCPDGQIVETALASVRGGVTLVQLRDKTSGTRAMVDCARALVAALTPHGVPLLVNDRVDVALAAGAAGVHLGQEDMDAVDARHLLGSGAIIGLTVKNAAQAEAAPVDVLDYVSFGGVFPTGSKHNPDTPIGIAGLETLVRILRGRADMPLCAIAGIGRDNAADVIGAGTDGVCVVSAITHDPDPTASAREIRRIVDNSIQLRKAAE